MMRQLPLHHIEGIWQFPATGAEVAIIRQDTSAETGPSSAAVTIYQIILLDSPSRTLRPGTIMGLITPSAARGEYNARIYTQSLGSTLLIPKSFTLTLSDQDASLRFVRHKGAFSINLWRLLPYLWRYTIHPNNTSDTKDDGCVRIFPNPPIPREPVYL